MSRDRQYPFKPFPAHGNISENYTKPKDNLQANESEDIREEDVLYSSVESHPLPCILLWTMAIGRGGYQQFIHQHLVV